LICIGIFPAVLSHVLVPLACCAAGYTAYVGLSLWCVGRRLSVAKPADTPLLIAKYEPDMTVGGVLQAKL